MGKKVVTPFRLAIAGVLCCAAGLAWMLVWHYSVRRPDTEMMAVDYYVPLFPRFIFLFGTLSLLTSGTWKVVAKLQRQAGGE